MGDLITIILMVVGLLLCVITFGVIIHTIRRNRAEQRAEEEAERLRHEASRKKKKKKRKAPAVYANGVTPEILKALGVTRDQVQIVSPRVDDPQNPAQPQNYPYYYPYYYGYPGYPQPEQPNGDSPETK